MTPEIDVAAINAAVEVLERGGLVAMPTETVYGLAADADNEARPCPARPSQRGRSGAFSSKQA